MYKQSALLALEDGSLFPGTAIGVPGCCVGEVIFNTSMTGYQEILTDPSYARQLITLTYPHIGNVGINEDDIESRQVWGAGLITKQLSPILSNWRAKQSFASYLVDQNVVGLTDVDTRHLTTLIREKGALRGCICNDNSLTEHEAIERAKQTPSMDGKDLTDVVTTRKAYVWQYPTTRLPGQEPYKVSKTPCRVVVYDFGVKQQILRLLVDLGCHITVVPARTTLKELDSYHPDGILLSNGPGDPVACTDLIANVAELLKRSWPILGICLGYQLLALASDSKTAKMKFGHHGANHPVQHLASKRVFITTQNHGFTVDESSLSPEWEVTHRSLFDGTLQGIRHRSKPFFGFQGHPEASPGPHDIQDLFAEFIQFIVQR